MRVKGLRDGATGSGVYTSLDLMVPAATTHLHKPVQAAELHLENRLPTVKDNLGPNPTIVGFGVAWLSQILWSIVNVGLKGTLETVCCHASRHVVLLSCS